MLKNMTYSPKEPKDVTTARVRIPIPILPLSVLARAASVAVMKARFEPEELTTSLKGPACSHDQAAKGARGGAFRNAAQQAETRKNHPPASWTMYDSQGMPGGHVEEHMELEQIGCCARTLK